MPEIEQLSYNVGEVVTMLLRERRIRTGRWTLLTKFNIGVANVNLGEGGPPPGPTLFAQLSELGIQKVPEGTPPGPHVVDAAEIWADAGTEK